MDHGRRQGCDEVLDNADKGIDVKLSVSVEETCVIREERTSGDIHDDPESNEELEYGPDEDMVQGMHDQRKMGDTLCEVDQRTSYNLRNSVNERIQEAVVVIDSADPEIEYVNRDNKELEAKVHKSGTTKSSMKVNGKDDDSCVNIDMKCDSSEQSSDGERICRICLLESDQSSDATASSANLIQLGCACKDELGIAHDRCAEVWFGLKRNRKCEICGQTAKNVSDIGPDRRFLEEWNERIYIEPSSRIFCGCQHGQPFCNFLMTCLVIAFVLPWFFHVNIF